MAKPQRDGKYLGEIVHVGGYSWIWMGGVWEEFGEESYAAAERMDYEEDE